MHRRIVRVELTGERDSELAVARSQPIESGTLYISDLGYTSYDYFADQQYTPNNPPPDGKIDTFYNQNGGLEIRWYSWYPNNNNVAGATPLSPGRPDDPDFPITWLPPTTGVT